MPGCVGSQNSDASNFVFLRSPVPCLKPIWQSFIGNVYEVLRKVTIMKCPNSLRFSHGLIHAFLILAFFAVTGSTALSQSGSSLMEPFDSGSLIIAMDNDKQGKGSGCNNSEAFNLRAYGLAVRLLYANVPLKWVIANKTTKDATDMTVNATRITGSNCQNGGTNTAFSGGPLVIPAEYASAATPVITTFNNEISGTDNDVRVYQANASFVAPVRYTLTHKPKIAVGPDGGGFGSGIYQELFDRAKLRDAANNPYYDNVDNIIISPDSCYTIAAQAHASSTAINFINIYRQFAESGGNLLLQCYSVDVFENEPIYGRFQTTLGWTVYGTNDNTAVNTTLAYPNPGMPFNQFIGILADTDGRVTEYSLANNSAFQNGTLVAATNTGGQNANKIVASVSRIGSSTAGGNVFELGGHAYNRITGGNNNTEIGRLNGERMALNSILVPATRPGCGLSIPSVKAFKVVRMSFDSNGNGLPNFGDRVEWELKYINDSNVDISNFQVSDPLDSKLIYYPSLIVTATSGSTAAPNPAYNGTSVTQMLASGALLKAGGMITIKVKTVVNGFGTILNQGTGTGTGIPGGGVKTDTADNTTSGTVAGYPIGCGTNGGCLSQVAYQTTSNQDPTGIDLGTAPSAGPANVQGRVVDATGRGIGRAMLTLQNANNGTVWTVISNSFGYFTFTEIPSGEFYVLTVQSKGYAFSSNSYAFELNDNIAGLTFVADSPSAPTYVPSATGTNSKSTPSAPLSRSKQRP